MLNCWHHHILLSIVSNILDNAFSIIDLGRIAVALKFTSSWRELYVKLLSNCFISFNYAPQPSLFWSQDLLWNYQHRRDRYHHYALEWITGMWTSIQNSLCIFGRKIQWRSLCQGVLPELERDTRVFCLLMQKIMKQSSFWCKSLLQVKALWWRSASRVKTLLWDPVQLFPAGQNSTGTDMRRRSIMAWDLLIISYFWPLILENDNLSGYWEENTFLFPWERLPTTRLPRWKAQSCHWFFSDKTWKWKRTNKWWIFTQKLVTGLY